MHPIIDFHVHPYREQQYCLNFYPEKEDFSLAAMRAELAGAGITHICGSVLKWSGITEFSQVEELNQEALALAEVLDGFYTPGFHVHPGFVTESCREVERMQRRGVNLLGELVPYIHGWQGGERALQTILEAAKPGLVCCYHTPTSLDMASVIQAFPNIRFVAAHPGDREQVGEHVAMMKRFENLYLDLSGTGLFRLGLVEHLVHQVGAERILFATDYPICNPRMYVQALFGEALSDETRERIFFRNAAQLLNMEKY